MGVSVKADAHDHIPMSLVDGKEYDNVCEQRDRLITLLSLCKQYMNSMNGELTKDSFIDPTLLPDILKDMEKEGI